MLQLQDNQKQNLIQQSLEFPWNNFIFVILLLINILNNFDTGIIPAAILNIQKQMDMTFIQLGTIGSLAYLGSGLGALFLPFFMSKIKIKILLIVLLICNSGCSVAVGISQKHWQMYLARFLMGISQSFISTYAPIWVNNFAPVNSSTTWMGIMSSFSSLGIMAGYSVASVIITVWYDNISSWRLGFYIQASLQIIIVFICFIIPNQKLDVWRQQNQPQQQQKPIFSKENLQKYCHVLSNFLYLYTTLGLTVLYFVVTGIQYWATSYTVMFFKVQQHYAMIFFAFDAITAPVCGVLIGGYIMDKSGGYKGAQRFTAAKFVTMFCIIGCSFGISAAFASVFLFAQILLWFMLFFGGGMVPIANGLCVSSVQKGSSILQEYQSISSSLTQSALNMIGFFFSPIFSGFVMDLFNDKDQGMTWGFRINLMICFIAVLFFSLATRAASKQPRLRAIQILKQANPAVFLHVLPTTFKKPRSLSIN